MQAAVVASTTFWWMRSCLVHDSHTAAAGLIPTTAAHAASTSLCLCPVSASSTVSVTARVTKHERSPLGVLEGPLCDRERVQPGQRAWVMVRVRVRVRVR